MTWTFLVWNVVTWILMAWNLVTWTVATYLWYQVDGAGLMVRG